MTDIGTIGVGTIGSTTAYSIALTEPAWDITFFDPDTDLATGHALDIESTNGHLGHSIGCQLFEGNTDRVPNVAVYEDMTEPNSPRNFDLLIVAASAPRPAGTDLRGGSRRAQLERNRSVISSVVDDIKQAGLDPTPTIVVTNPLDRMVVDLNEGLIGWDRRYFVGYSLSETAHLARAISRRKNVQAELIRCPVMGEHGENMVPVFSRARIGGEPLLFTAEEREVIREEMRDVGYDVIQLRGMQQTSRWVSGFGVSLLARSIIHGGPSEPVCLSTPLDGEYGYSDVALGVPVNLSSDGIRDILEWNLTDQEWEQLDRAYESITRDI